MKLTIYNNIESKDIEINSFKIVVVGEIYSGKYSFVNRICNRCFEETREFQYTDFKIGFFKNERNEFIKTQLWIDYRDQRFRNQRYYLLKDMHSMVFVYDITTKRTFDCIVNYLYPEYQDYILKQQPEHPPQLMVIGNKSDLRGQINSKQSVDTEEAREFANSIGALFFEVSAKDNINIDESAIELIKNLKKNFNNNINQPNNNNDDQSFFSNCIIN
ncbi:hypothetical protein DICPUDRAFT_84758 [Dictyostelium purpureum]|uniref:Rab GTPase n=1 Tax=Dictyostelium purpureum TaxID=5786 RepID=F1A3N0_DICPU|nr:uncharacterized protein DICPUDRAFT_84758 [Dictyostelium purpureum]EGC29202.1 hypothetical protein DICPUDRAFT_84758 [Dictyostelium purpureum]|eukprot:XP_003294273.1 hypothetical protein DICPUDRAFT_84758 [Dictyostelium purpureum]